MNPANQKRWLVKFAPFRTPWAEIVRRGTFSLRGVRNRVARKYLKEMRLGDQVLYYHSQQELAVVGLMEVTREAYPDPTSTDPQWLTCDFIPTQTLVNPVTLGQIKSEPSLTTLTLIRQPRLAVMPITEQEFHIILKLSNP